MEQYQLQRLKFKYASLLPKTCTDGQIGQIDHLESYDR